MSPRSRALSGTPVLQMPQARHVRGGPQATERRLVGAKEVPLDQVLPHPQQPRKDWEHAEGSRRLEELAASIREFGVLQPLLVSEDGALEDGRQCYRIIAGGRRRLAAERAGLSVLPVVVREATDRLRLEQLQENLQRQDLSPLDEARAFQELLDLGRQSPPEVAARLCISAQHVRDRLRLLADQVLADAVERRQISASAAREIMKLPDDEMLAFRERVACGEQLRTNDVATARARLAAAGIVNTRRKGAPLPPQSPPREIEIGHSVLLPEQTVFVSSEMGIDGQPPAEMPGQAAGAILAGGSGTDPSTSLRSQIRALVAPCTPEQRALLARLLDIGITQEWSCAELKRQLGEDGNS